MLSNDTFHIDDYLFQKKIDRITIQEKVKELAQRINNDYKDKQLTFIIVLRGAFIFAADLVRLVDLPTEILFVDSKSYGSNLHSSGKVTLNIGNIDLAGKDVIIIEDIVDTGRSLKELTSVLKQQQPKSLEIAALLSKPEERYIKVDVKYIGFEIPSDFVIGYGLDYNEKGRHLPHIYSKI